MMAPDLRHKRAWARKTGAWPAIVPELFIAAALPFLSSATMRYRSSLLSSFPCARLLSTRAIAPTDDGIRISAPAMQSATQIRARKMILVSGDARLSAITQINQRIKILPPTRHAIACAHAAAQRRGGGAVMSDAVGCCFGRACALCVQTRAGIGCAQSLFIAGDDRSLDAEDAAPRTLLFACR
jgi:hypothetical protein